MKQASWGSLTTQMLSIWKGWLQEVDIDIFHLSPWLSEKKCYFVPNQKASHEYIAYSKWIFFLGILWTNFFFYVTTSEKIQD